MWGLRFRRNWTPHKDFILEIRRKEKKNTKNQCEGSDGMFHYNMNFFSKMFFNMLSPKTTVSIPSQHTSCQLLRLSAPWNQWPLGAASFIAVLGSLIGSWTGSIPMVIDIGFGGVTILLFRSGMSVFGTGGGVTFAMLLRSQDTFWTSTGAGEGWLKVKNKFNYLKVWIIKGCLHTFPRWRMNNPSKSI